MTNYYENMEQFPQYVRVQTSARAIQWTGDNLEEIFKFIPINKIRFKNNKVYIKTINGRVKLRVGDYIVSNGPDDFYPLREENFKKHYIPYEEKNFE